MHVARYTEEFRRQELAQGQKSLWYFALTILGFGSLDQEWSHVQYELAERLEARSPHPPWRRMLVCAYRGGFKSSLTTQAYPWWRALYIPGFTVKMIENSSDNAKLNHFAPMVHLFTQSQRADYLQWLYQHRIPTSFEGWNSLQVQLLKGPDPFSAPTITYWGLESKKEGTHVDLVVLDDADGADAKKNPERNHHAFSMYQAAIPLLKNPRTGQILVVGTPHGPNPLVYQLRDREADGSLDNSRRKVKVFWLPLEREDGTIEEPKRFPPSVVEELKMDRENWETQYQLRRPGGSLEIFDMEKVRDSFYRWLDPERTVIRYRGYEHSEEVLRAFREGGEPPELVATEETVAIDECYPTFSVDPTHRLKQLHAHQGKSSRPSEAAITVTLTAPDGHVFLWKEWSKDCEVDELIQEMFRLYRVTGAMAISWETVGAQVWLKAMVEQAERSMPAFLRMEHIGAFGRRSLPRMSQRMVEFSRGNEPKAELYRTQLSAYVNSGILHLHPEHIKTYAQLASPLDATKPVDLLDTLAQGAATGIWKAPPPPDEIRRFRQRKAWVDRRLQAGKRKSLRSPYAGRHPAYPGVVTNLVSRPLP